MKINTIKALFWMLVAGLVFSSCTNKSSIIPSGKVTSQSRTFTDYTGIEVSSALTVDVSYSNTEELIEVEVDDNLHQYIEITKTNNTLKIKIKDNTNINGNATLKIHITTKDQIGYFSASGASQIFLNTATITDDITLALSGASIFNGTIENSSLNASIDGASVANLSGNSNSLSLIASGASVIGGFDYELNTTNIQLSGASQASFSINQSIDVTASGASSLRYKGNPIINSSNLSGASELIKVN